MPSDLPSAHAESTQSQIYTMRVADIIGLGVENLPEYKIGKYNDKFDIDYIDLSNVINTTSYDSPKSSQVDSKQESIKSNISKNGNIEHITMDKIISLHSITSINIKSEIKSELQESKSLLDYIDTDRTTITHRSDVADVIPNDTPRTDVLPNDTPSDTDRTDVIPSDTPSDTDRTDVLPSDTPSDVRSNAARSDTTSPGNISQVIHQPRFDLINKYNIAIKSLRNQIKNTKGLDDLTVLADKIIELEHKIMLEKSTGYRKLETSKIAVKNKIDKLQRELANAQNVLTYINSKLDYKINRHSKKVQDTYKGMK